MRFTILTQYFPPERGAAQNRLHSLALALRDRDHDVTVLTAKPNYPHERIDPEFAGGIYRTSFEQGIHVIRCWLHVSSRKSVVARILNYLSFTLMAALVGFWSLPRTQILIVESPPLFLGLTGRVLALLKSARIVFNVSDPYPQIAVDLGLLKSGFLTWLLQRLEAACYRSAALVTGQSEGIIESVRRRFPSVSTLVVTNGVDFSGDLANEPAAACSKGNSPFIVGFAGVHAYSQKLENVLEAADMLRDEAVEFVLFGDGPFRETLMRNARERGLRVRFPGSIDRAELHQAMRSWNAMVVPLADRPVMKSIIPAKLFDSMGSGLPVILSAPDGDAASIVSRAACGIVVPPENPSAMAEAVRRLMRDPQCCDRLGRSARAYAVRHFDRKQLNDRMIDEMEKLVTLAPVS